MSYNNHNNNNYQQQPEHDTLDLKEMDLQMRKNQIMLMLSEIKQRGHDHSNSHDGIAMEDIDSVRLDQNI